MFYVLEGAVRVLSGTQILRAQRGDLIVVPPHLPHAFSAEYGSKAEILIVIAPGVERFEYFRKITRIAQGQERPESLRDVQELYDTYFLKSPEWEEAQSEMTCLASLDEALRGLRTCSLVLYYTQLGQPRNGAAHTRVARSIETGSIYYFQWSSAPSVGTKAKPCGL
jgi:hypothetical protein